MRFRVGAVCGFAVGYYLGARAGRERYEQLRAAARRAQRSGAVGVVLGKARAVADLGFERARGAVETRLGSDERARPTAPR